MSKILGVIQNSNNILNSYLDKYITTMPEVEDVEQIKNIPDLVRWLQCAHEPPDNNYPDMYADIKISILSQIKDGKVKEKIIIKSGLEKIEVIRNRNMNIPYDYRITKITHYLT